MIGLKTCCFILFVNFFYMWVRFMARWHMARPMPRDAVTPLQRAWSWIVWGFVPPE